MAQLDFKQVTFTGTDSTVVIKNIALSVHTGDFISVVGPSGSGKSTFLKLCNNLISPTSGTVLYNGKNEQLLDPTQLRKEVVYCFQTPYLFGGTVNDNMAFPFKLRDLPVDRTVIEPLFNDFKMSLNYLQKNIGVLSVGEKQRIALIRSLLFKPKIILLDEITSALDAANTKIVEDVIVALNQTGTTVIWVTHSQTQSKKYSSRIIQIDAGKLTVLKGAKS